MIIEPFDRQLQQLRGLSARLAQQIATLSPSDQPALADTAAALDDALDNLSTQFLQSFELIDYKFFGVAQDISARRQVEEALRHQTERLNMLHAIDQAILAAQSPETIAQEVVGQLDRLIPGGQISLVLFDIERQEAQVLATAGVGGADLPAGARLPLAPLLEVAAKPVQSADLATLAEQLPGLRPLLAAGLCTAITAPLNHQGELIGMLHVLAASPDALGHDSTDFLGQVAGQLAVAIQQSRLFELVRAGRQRLQNLSHRLLNIQETERRHIAHELHDEIGQALTALKINLQALQQAGQGARPARHLEESISIVEVTIEQVRNLALDLRPALLDELGLVPALRWFLDRQRQRAGLKIDFVAEPPELSLPADLATVCFRVVQEALTNVTRHAHASYVRVELRQRAADLLLVVQDDGAGFDVAAALGRAGHGASLGLLGLQERVLLVGGQVTIASTPSVGTTITALLPNTPNMPLERRRRGGAR